METEFDIILDRISQHFTPAELIEFLEVSFETLFSSDKLVESIEENIEDLKEELGID